MSMQPAADSTEPGSGIELTSLGKRIELLRIERGLSKQWLARYAGTSRQQLWRVMTGKSELTSSLRLRLAEVLQVDATALTATRGNLASTVFITAEAPIPQPVATATLAEYVSSVPALERTLATLPDGGTGWRLKRLFLNCVEEVAADAGLCLPPEYFELRRQITNRDRRA